MLLLRRDERDGTVPSDEEARVAEVAGVGLALVQADDAGGARPPCTGSGMRLLKNTLRHARMNALDDIPLRVIRSY